MFFGMMEAQRGYNTGQTEDYLKYKWIGLEVKGFQLVLDFGFGFLGQVDDFGVAAAFEVEDAFGGPAVFVVTDQAAGGV